jgi:hypothetical protein
MIGDVALGRDGSAPYPAAAPRACCDGPHRNTDRTRELRKCWRTVKIATVGANLVRTGMSPGLRHGAQSAAAPISIAEDLTARNTGRTGEPQECWRICVNSCPGAAHGSAQLCGRDRSAKGRHPRTDVGNLFAARPPVVGWAPAPRNAARQRVLRRPDRKTPGPAQVPPTTPQISLLPILQIFPSSRSLPARPAGVLSFRRAHEFPGSHGPVCIMPAYG